MWSVCKVIYSILQRINFSYPWIWWILGSDSKRSNPQLSLNILQQKSDTSPCSIILLISFSNRLFKAYED